MAHDPRHRARVQVRQQNWFFLVSADDIHRLESSAIIDILRYDQAVPQNSPPDGYILLLSREFPTTARWTTFGVPVLVTSRDREDAIRQLIALGPKPEPARYLADPKP